MDILDILFPIICIGCGKRGEYICKRCIIGVKSARTPCFDSHYSSIDNLSFKTKPSFDFIYSAWEYSGAIRKVILQLKYRFVYGVAGDLATQYIEKLNRDIPSLPIKAVLIPIPLSRDRKNWRGFNQSEILGKIIAEGMGWYYESNCLKRARKTRPQTELKGKERAKNLSNAFFIKEGYRVKNMIYILFDDVLTTGSTLKEACKVLKRNGVKTVWGMTIAA